MITKAEWRSGEYHSRPEFSTQSKYYDSVSEFVQTYGEPTKEDMIVARSGEYKEFQKKEIGASWNPSLNNTRSVAKLYGADTIYAMFVPKGTMAVHFQVGEGEGRCSLEEEYVFDIKGMGLNCKKGWGEGKHHLGIIARHKGEWDYATSDFETDKDFENWQLLRKDWLASMSGTDTFNTFFD